MSNWAKVKFFYETMLGSAGSTLTATSTASGGYSVDYLYNMLEVNGWRASGADSPQYIIYDAGPGNARAADYLAVLGHNLASGGATVVLQYSDDGVNYSDAFTPFFPEADTVLLKEFPTTPESRYYRLVITGQTEPVYMSICVWGLSTELDYATASFDPNSEEAVANVNLSYGGYVSGVHRRYTGRAMTVRFHDADSALYAKVREWWRGSGLKNFLVAWESNNNPSDVFLMRPAPRFHNPLKDGGLSRDITIDLRGRKE